MRSGVRSVALGFVGFLLISIGGCSSGPVTGMVQGEVTLDGQPLAKGNVNLEPLDGKTQTAGTTITDGKFEVKVGVGKSRVRITANKVIGQRQAYPGPNSPIVDEVVELIPAKYNAQSELEVDVGPGTTPAKFDLLSK